MNDIRLENPSYKPYPDYRMLNCEENIIWMYFWQQDLKHTKIFWLFIKREMKKEKTDIRSEI